MANPVASEVPFLRHMGLIMTLRCQVVCRHCAVEAGPHRTEEIAEAESLGWIRQAAAYRGGYVRTLSLTGGEPFSVVGKLRRVSEFASDFGMLVTVVTNAHWATEVKSSVRLLRSIPGLRMIGISADASHQEAIPFQRVRNVGRVHYLCEDEMVRALPELEERTV